MMSVQPMMEYALAAWSHLKEQRTAKKMANEISSKWCQNEAKQIKRKGRNTNTSHTKDKEDKGNNKKTFNSLGLTSSF